MLRPPPVHAPRTSPAPAAAAAPAFDSHPSDVVLVKSYLRPWVAQGVRPRGALVHATDLYAAEPGDLARRYRAAVTRDGERAWYFLSPLRTKNPRGRRKSRTVEGGTGWWHGEAGPKPVLDGRRKVGYRQSFSFMRRGADGAPVRTGWIMLELRLHGDDDDSGCGGGLGDKLEGLVLCKVYRSARHPETAAAHDDGDEKSCAAAAPEPGGRHSIAADGEGSSDAPLVAAVAPGGKRKADGEEVSMRHVKNADGENEVSESGAATSAAPGLKEKEAADGYEDSSASTTARKRARTAGDEGPGAASALAPAPALMRKAAVVAPAPQQLQYCPQCGFHISMLQAVVALAKSTSETGMRVAQLMRKAAVVAPAPQQLQYCPQCGFHISLLQAVVALAKSTSETGMRIAHQAGAPQGGGRTGHA